MAFQHFHRHSKKYMVIFFVATLFSLFTFNVTSAILQAFSGALGGAQGSAMRFKTIDGRMAGLSAEELTAAQREVAGIAQPILGFDMQIARDHRNAWLAHVMLLADADSFGIEIPDDVVEQQITNLKQKIQYIASIQQRGAVVTEADYESMLHRFGLSQATLFERVRESMKIDAYVRSMSGPDIQDPEDVIERFQVRNELVTLEYVAFSFDHFNQELHKSPPSDADLEAWWNALPAPVITMKYSRDERFTLDLATLDGDAFDASKVDPALIGTVTDPTDDEVVSEAKRDPLRYAAGKAPEKAADVDAAGRAKITSDRKLKVLVDKAKAEFEAAVNALPALTEPKADATDDEKKAADAARAARKVDEAKLFGDVARKYGFELKHYDDQEPKQLDEIDPPKNSMLRLLVNGLPAQTIIHSCSSLPARDAKYAFMARVDDHKAKEKKPFADVKAQVLEQWIEEHAKERAEEAAQAFLDGVIDDARKTAPAERFAAIDQKRDEGLKAADDDKDLGDEKRKLRKSAEHATWSELVQSVIGAPVSATFGTAATAKGLTVARVGPQRRSVKDSPHFHDRFSGAERYLWSQNGGSSERSARLLGFGVGMMSDVLVDDEGKACYVARIVARARPAVEEMMPNDRDEAERENQQWIHARRLVPYLNPFSYTALIATHSPEMLSAGHRPTPQDSDF